MNPEMRPPGEKKGVVGKGRGRGNREACPWSRNEAWGGEGKDRGQQGLHGGRRNCRKIVFENAITKLNTSSANFKTKLNK